MLAEVGGRVHQRYGPKRGRVLEVVGREDEPRAASMLAIHAHGLPTGFSAAAEAEADAAEPPVLGDRVDLRDLPLITIDPSDARDHDDAVFAQPDDDPGEPRRLGRLGRHRRRRRLRAPGLGARPRGPGEGQQRLFPRSRRADAAGAAVGGPLLAAGRRELRACIAVRMAFDAAGRKRAHRFIAV